MSAIPVFLQLPPQAVAQVCCKNKTGPYAGAAAAGGDDDDDDAFVADTFVILIAEY